MFTRIALIALVVCTQFPNALTRVITQVSSVEQGTLSPGGSFTSSAGVTIRAPAEVLNAPAEVFARSVSSSSSLIPLPSGWLPVGNSYLVGASTEVFSKTNDLFEIEIPVSAGIDSKGLSVATLLPADFGPLPQKGIQAQPLWISTAAETRSGVVSIKSKTSTLANVGFLYVLVRRNNVLSNKLQPAQVAAPQVVNQAGVQSTELSVEQGILNPGGSFTNSAGVSIRAPSGVLNAPVGVFARRTDASDFPIGLPRDWSQIGHAYRIGATDGASFKNRDSFQIELPVSAGADSRGLSIATFFPTSFPVDGEDQPPYWDRAIIQKVSGLSVLRTMARELNSAGFIYVLVRRNDVPMLAKSPRHRRE